MLTSRVAADSVRVSGSSLLLPASLSLRLMGSEARLDVPGGAHTAPGADPKGQGAGFSTQARKLENEPQIN